MLRNMEKKMSKRSSLRLSLKKELVGILCLILALAVFSAAAGKVLTPKRLDYGATWDMYLKEPKDTVDVLFFGTSLAYFDVVPAVIYDETGITSYVMAGPEQTFPVTYSYLTEACKTQSPQAVFVEATGLLTGQSNRSLKVNLTYMPWGWNRLATTFEEANEDELPGLLFPLYAYHDRWDDLTDQDWQIGLHGYETDPLAGYTFMAKSNAIEGFEERELEDAEENYARNLEVARKMVDFCKENGIQLFFFFSPVTERIDDELTERIEGDLAKLSSCVVNYNRLFDEIGFDLSADFYDPLHTNAYGAEKFSRFLADHMASMELRISPGGREDKALWRSRVETFAQKLREGEVKG